jgi:predicted nucleotidyltransferase component of viral defense system
MDIEVLNKIKRLALIGLFVDDYFLDKLVFKGGNALDLIHRIAHRGSIDLDFSIEEDFDQKNIEIIKSKLKKGLKSTFNENGFEFFDFDFSERPANLDSERKEFWGGYQILFKVIEAEKYDQVSTTQANLRRNAIEVGFQKERKFRIDISKHEYCQGKLQTKLDGYTIYVYPLEMILIEKIRAICQQLPAYKKIKKSNSVSARARDFFDIYTIWEYRNINLLSPENIELLKAIFAAKKVPLSYMGELYQTREDHRSDFKSVEDTVGPNTNLKEFDFYFDYVIDKLKYLEPLWIE